MLDLLIPGNTKSGRDRYAKKRRAETKLLGNGRPKAAGDPLRPYGEQEKLKMCRRHISWAEGLYHAAKRYIMRREAYIIAKKTTLA